MRWLVCKVKDDGRWLDRHGRWTRLYLFAHRFRTRRAAERAARLHAGACVIREEDFDAFPE